jgi:hypothetical protein
MVRSARFFSARVSNHEDGHASSDLILRDASTSRQNADLMRLLRMRSACVI